ncbi:M24 family metallopeptidase [Parabacteroides pacaensis]|uniref:M24 family metallopeptidase n=1 Tax=Parabacteroides pacaensis TaxID=2086575 RepID=UPI000D104EC0|nr:Xaa-Pro peptidase family protein [Parabacteroides pacaensis]
MINTELESDLQLKWSRIQHAMQQNNFEGCLLTVDVNLYYTTGKVFSGYIYFPASGNPLFFIKRPNGVDGNNIYYIRKPEQIPDILSTLGIKKPEKLLLEGDELPYNEYMRLLKILAPQETGNATTLIRSLRAIKTPWEISQFRQAARAHEDTYRQIPSCFHSGMTDLELQIEIEKRMRQNGSFGLFRAFGSNMDIFMGSILAGENAETPSAFDFALGGAGIHPSVPLGANGTLLKEGTAIMVDMAGNYTAYMTDMTRVYSVGTLPDLAYKAHQVALDIQNEIMNYAKPGVPCSEVYGLAAKMAENEHLAPYFMGTKQQAKFVGHGVGIQINELPVFTPRSKEILEPNMVFALEPKFVIPGVGAVGIENTFLVTDDTIEKITRFEENIIQLH